MLVILSPHSVASRWVERELAFADAKGKRVLPLLYKPCGLPASFELRFGNVQRADFSRGSYETNLAELLASIEQVLGLTVAPPAPAPSPKPPAEPAPEVLTITSPIHLELVRVQAGEFLMGSDPAKDKDADDDEQPQHRVYLSEFYIGKTPVTNAQYAAFVKATKHEAPEHWERGKILWKGGKIPSGKENHPVVHVSWNDAVAFCQWLNQETGQLYRLPTEAEREKAARGTDGRIYPWGNGQPTAELGNFDDNVRRTTPVGQYSPKGNSPYGCADMAGNVWEWCADWFDEQEYQRRAKSTVKDPQGPQKGTSRVLRGGAFHSNRELVRCACRYRDVPRYHYRGRGFRVVVPPVPSDL
jgi:formylglycine-generating enzyme required for sulfatase activity